MPSHHFLRNIVKFALTKQEIQICLQQSIKTDSRVQTHITYPTGLIDVMGIGKTEETSHLICDTKDPLLFIILHLRRPSTSGVE